MTLTWQTRLRPVLSALAERARSGDRVVDTSDYAAVLGMTPDDIADAMKHLSSVGFVQASTFDGASWRVERVCPLTFQVLCLDLPSAVELAESARPHIVDE